MRLLALGAALALLAAPAPSPEAVWRFRFEGSGGWRAAPAEGVELRLAQVDGARGKALRLDFDFHGRAGWAAIRREVALDLPENWELDLTLRGETLPNDLQVKLVDRSGENVWWAVRRGFEPPFSWTTLRLKKRHFSFAWGPAGGGEIPHVAAIEIVVAAGRGGRGWIALDDLSLEPRPVERPYDRVPSLAASSSASGHEPRNAMDGDPDSSWRSGEGEGRAFLAIDFGERREYGGLVIDWEPGRFAKRYEVETSDDGREWSAVRAVEQGSGGRDYLYLPESESRQVRLRLEKPGQGPGYGIREIRIEPLAFSETPNAFFEAVAKDAPRGTYPRSFSGEQSYWTVVGVDGDAEKALLGEDGAIEAGRGGFSVEPFLFFDGELTRWSDARPAQTLARDDLPIPSVTWRRGGLSFSVTALAFGPRGSSAIEARYRVVNRGSERRRGRLFLAVRPFQVNPPTQFLNGAGGVTTIRALDREGGVVRVNGEKRIFPESAPGGFGAAPFEAGPITDFLARGVVPPDPSCRDGFGYASGALAFALDLPPGAEREVRLVIPLHPGSVTPGAAPPEAARKRLAASVRAWEKKLGRVGIGLPESAAPLVRTLRSNLAFILVNRDGPALQPGARAYARSWIRDGAMTSAALLRLGHADAAREFLEWYARFVEPSGRVPCCVDRRGADPVVENDSHGEFLYLAAEFWRFTRDRTLLERLYPRVGSVVSWIDRLRRERRAPEFDAPGKLVFRGLLPESISHEGYSARPVHSYWDDFWALRGLKDAVTLARALGRPEEAARWAAIRDAFAADLHASIRRTIETRDLDYIPGSAELADFDPTSTTIALDPAGELSRLPPRELERTFERYYEEFIRRRDGGNWNAYTPYELRNVGAFVRLGWRDRAQALLRFFLEGRRPAAWNQWAEVVGGEARVSRFVGDMPHTWVGSDFIRSFLDLFAWDRESDGALVLAAGIPEDWLRGGPGVSVRRLRTRHGPLSYALREEKGILRFSISGDLAIPPGGIALRPPLESPPGRVAVNGRAVPFSGEELVIRELPAEVVFER